MDTETDIKMVKKKFHLAEPEDAHISELFGHWDPDAQDVYVAEVNGEITGAIIIRHEQPESYGRVAWCIHVPSSEALYINRIMVLPEYVGKGITMALLLFAERLALRYRKKTIRFDETIKDRFDPQVFERKGYECRENNGGVQVYEKVIFPWDLKKY